jgi:hypothetical protein
MPYSCVALLQLLQLLVLLLLVLLLLVLVLVLVLLNSSHVFSATAGGVSLQTINYSS